MKTVPLFSILFCLLAFCITRGQSLTASPSIHPDLQGTKEQPLPALSQPGDLYIDAVHIDTGLSFTEISAGLMNVYRGSIEWGDCDNDGDLDIFMVGKNDGGVFVTKLYRNLGGGSFSEISNSFPGVIDGCAAWGDFDNDGDVDILFNGWTGSTYLTRVYRNDGEGIFTNINAGLPGVHSGNDHQDNSAAWGDYDNDGDLDILLTGDDGSDYITQLYRNDGKGVFTNTYIAIPGVYRGTVRWGDYDNDRDLDILIIGVTNATSISRVYRNDGDGVFTDIMAGLPGVDYGSAAWGDYDNDGDLDIVLNGDIDGSTNISKIFRNDGHDTFTDIHAALTAMYSSSVTWGDYDNDGDLDILMAGSIPPSRKTILYRNNGSGIFTEISTGIIATASGYVTSGDYDNDGDLDILLIGHSPSKPVTKLYRNNIVTSNDPPEKPSGCTASTSEISITFQWNKSVDDHTNPNSITYALRVGTTPGGSQISSPFANTITGYRKIPGMGNTNHDTSWVINNLVSGTYYWSVQAIDNGFAGSTFSDEQSIIITGTSIQDDIGLPANFSLEQNYPNPFNPATTIHYALPTTAYVRLSVYNMLGQEMLRLVDGIQDAGYKTVNVNAYTLPSGVYCYRLDAGTFTQVKKMLLLK
jgi:hypothetical protein